MIVRSEHLKATVFTEVAHHRARNDFCFLSILLLESQEVMVPCVLEGIDPGRDDGFHRQVI